ncbi:hypothetical protein P8C59_000461 [Phyllachora maydis]|uniref:Uncharacterized protein n=1 Tax=Phyllachora maydis TaxID=1825666 RepID=A0AAD9HXQ6_9PEZI|nr:hypothetical protein P8C59_000461 [Phyllachora maydis]
MEGQILRYTRDMSHHHILNKSTPGTKQWGSYMKLPFESVHLVTISITGLSKHSLIFEPHRQVGMIHVPPPTLSA